eukprot:10864584-Alexandrium_andersonii.AAC.1
MHAFARDARTQSPADMQTQRHVRTTPPPQQHAHTCTCQCTFVHAELHVTADMLTHMPEQG